MDGWIKAFSGTLPSDSGDLEEAMAKRVTDAVREALDAWPTLGIDGAEFALYLGERVAASESSSAKDSTESALDDLHAADLYLASGCAAGVPAALEAFESTLGAVIKRVASRFEASGLTVDDSVQIVRERILVGTADRPPRIATYRGRGSLKAWVRAAAVTSLIDQTRTERKRKGELLGADDAFEQLPAPGDDPEIEHLKRNYRAEFKRAFEAAVAELGSAGRNLLRYHYVHSLTIDELGALYGVHRATAARRLAAARSTLLRETRTRLRRTLGVAQRDVDSIMRLIESRLEVSMERLLTSVRSEPGDAEHTNASGT